MEEGPVNMTPATGLQPMATGAIMTPRWNASHAISRLITRRSSPTQAWWPLTRTGSLGPTQRRLTSEG
jgi:hypothetical protein